MSGRILAAQARALPIGTAARVRVSGRVYLAEVRCDFGRPQWFGSWHGFALPADRKVEVVDLIPSQRDA